MHQRVKNQSEKFTYNGDNRGNETIDFAAAFRSARRQSRVILVSVLSCLLIAIGYLSIAPKKYRAQTSIIIEADSYNRMGKDQMVSSIDSSDVDSQVEVLKSERVAQSVIDKLSLYSDPAFFRTSLTTQLFSSGTGKTVRDSLGQRVLSRLASATTVKRVDKTYVINVSYVSEDPNRASEIANSITDAYMQEQQDARVAVARQASEWLGQRLTDLKDQSITADVSVQQYRAQNNLIESGGRLVNEQQVTQLNEQVIAAQSEAAKADSRLSTIKSIIDSHDLNANVSDTLNSPIITELRQKYLNVSKRAIELEARLGPAHMQVVNLKSEMKSYEDQIFGELARTAESYLSDSKIAHARLDEMTLALSRALMASASDNTNLVDLREKERNSEIYKTQYQSFLEKYQDLLQQQTYPIAKARVITRAVPPSGPSQPQAKIVLTMGLIGGLMLGVGFALAREAFDKTFRTPQDVRLLGLPFLGIIPDYRKKKAGRGAGVEPDAGTVQPTIVASSYSLSKAADTLRSVKVAIDHRAVAACPIIGVISINSGDGKTYTSLNLAMTLAQAGRRVLLIDGDLRRQGLSRQFHSGGRRGLVDSIAGAGIEVDLINLENIAFLCASAKGEPEPYSSDILSSPEMSKLLEQMQTQFDYIVIDLPPTAPVPDANAIAPRLTDILLVLSWGKTQIDDVNELLDESIALRRKCIGAVLNCVDPERFPLYSSNQSRDYADLYY